MFLGTGASIPTCMQVPGIDLPGVFPPDEFLARTNVDPAILPEGWREPLTVGKRVAVIGGGDTASDCLRTALRKGANPVTCLYRRTETEMPGGKKDRALAGEEGAEFRFLTQPIRFIPGPDGRVERDRVPEMRVGRTRRGRPPAPDPDRRIQLHRGSRHRRMRSRVRRRSGDRPDYARTRDRQERPAPNRSADRRHIPARDLRGRRRGLRPGPGGELRWPPDARRPTPSTVSFATPAPDRHTGNPKPLRFMA